MKSVGERLSTLESDVANLRNTGGGETPVPIGGGGNTGSGDTGGGNTGGNDAAIAAINKRLDDDDQRIRTMIANTPNPDAVANREAALTSRVTTLEGILGRVLVALGDVYDNAAADRQTLSGGAGAAGGTGGTPA